MAIRRTQITVVTAGSSGSATGYTDSAGVIDGDILSVHINYDGSAPSTTDITIAEANNDPSTPVLTKANNNADGWFYPRNSLNAVSDGSALTGPVDYVRVNDKLRFTVSQANNDQTFVATVKWDDRRL